jgi:hypothetical protein
VGSAFLFPGLTLADVSVPPTVTGVFNVPAGEHGDLFGTITLDNGVIDVDGTLVSETGNIRITGNGQVLLNEPSGRWSHACCFLQSVTIDPGVEVLGQKGTSFSSTNTVNRGTFAAVDGGPISGTFTIMSVFGFVNEGVMEARDGGALHFSSATANTFGDSSTLRAHAGGRILIHGPTLNSLNDLGTVENLGGLVQLYNVDLNNHGQTTTFTGGDWSLLSATKVFGGTLAAADGGRLRIGTQGSSSFIANNPVILDAVTLATDVYLNSSSRLKPTGGLILNDASVRFDGGTSYLFVDAASPISGNGELVSVGSGTGRIEATGGTISIPEGIAVRSTAGTLFFTRQSGAPSGDFDIAGPIEADGGTVSHNQAITSRGDVIARNGGTIDINSLWTNVGNMRIEAGGILDLGATLENQGSIEVENGIVLIRGTQITGPGAVLITDSRVLASGSTTFAQLMAIDGVRVDRGVYVGTLDLQGQTIEIGSQPGQRWTFADGTFMNGVINSIDGTELVPDTSLSFLGKPRGVLRDLEVNANVRIPTTSEITVTGPLTGSGNLVVDGGRLIFGSFGTTLSSSIVDRITPLSGAVTLAGGLDNVGSTITLNQGVTWNVSHLRSDLFIGGRVEGEPGVELIIDRGYGAAEWATFRQGVTLAVPMWIRGGFTSGAYVREGLTLDGAIISIGNPNSQEAGESRLVFQGAQTLSGTGEIRFLRPGNIVGNPTFPRVSMIEIQNSSQSTAGLTVADGIVVRTWEADAYIGGSYNYQQLPLSVPLVNEGTLLAENGHTLSLFVNNFQQRGVLRAEADSSLIINAPPQMPGAPIVNSERIESALGDVRVNGNLDLATGSVLSIELSLDQVAGAEPIAVTGHAQLTGLLEILAPEDTWSPSVGDSFSLLAAAGGVDGKFSAHHLPALDSGLFWELDVGDNAVTLEVVDSPIPGDFNSDGTVNAADYVVERKFGGTPPGAWQSQSNVPADPGRSNVPAVPEPAAAIMLIMGAAIANCSSRQVRWRLDRGIQF